MSHYIRSFKINMAIIAERYKIEKAYIADLWGGAASTLVFMATFIVFVDLIYRRVGQIGDYTRNDMLVLTFLGQLSFFTIRRFSLDPALDLIQKVNTGRFDYFLLRPHSVRQHLLANTIQPISILTVNLTPLLLLSFFINWGDIHTNTLQIMAAITVFLCAQLLIRTITLILTLPVFYIGESTELVYLIFGMTSVTQIPYNLLSKSTQILSFVLAPTIISTAASGGVLLGKIHASLAFTMLAVAITCHFIYNYAWKKAMNAYSSASS